MDKLKLGSGKHIIVAICSAAVQVRFKLFKIYSNGN